MKRETTPGPVDNGAAEAPTRAPRRSWREAAAAYTRPHILMIGLLGVASGLPLALTGATLSFWLASENIDKGTIGLFTWVTAPFMFKFLWAPLVDRARLPGVVRFFGQRRGWLIVVQLALAAAIFALGTSDPGADVTRVAVLALIVAALSATQDIIIDGYRVALLPPEEQGHGAAISVLGYRLGMLASGAGALFIVGAGGWLGAYAAMSALLVVIGLVMVIFAREPATPVVDRAPEGMAAWVRDAVWTPLVDFTKRRHWIVLLVFIGLYRISDILAGAMAMPLYYELGYTPAEIASITKVIGLLAIIVGGLLGGALLARLGILRGLLVCGLLQMVSNLGFAGLAMVGHRLDALAGVIVLENLAGGMGATALVALLSALCNIRFAATQYALLTSATALFGKTIASYSGFMAESMGWPTFFVVTAATALPALMLLAFIMRRPPQELSGGPKPGDKIPSTAAAATSAESDPTVAIKQPTAA